MTGELERPSLGRDECDNSQEERVSTPNALTQTARSEMPGFQGRLTGPEDPDYDEARKVYNAMIDRRPALIATCADSDDVAKVVSFAAGNELLLAVRGGGHNGGGLGTCDDGVVLDLSGLKGIRGRPRRPHGAGRRRLPLGRSGCRDQRARAGDAQRDHLDHRRRRPHARRRPRPPDPQMRPDDRQPARGGGRARQRRAGPRRRGREPRPLLGDPGRRRQLRRRHLVPLPTARGRHDRRRPDLLAGRAGRRGADGLPRLPAERPAGAERLLRLRLRSAGAAVPRGAPPAQGLRRRLVLRRATRKTPPRRWRRCWTCCRSR